MNPGLMDRQIELQRVTVTKSPGGAPSQSWAKLADIWAQVVPVSGNEVMKFQREVSQQVAKFRIWFYPGLTAKDRIVYGGQNWDILHIAEVGRGEAMEILAQVHA